jgi:GT2 family glycosyltransferase
MFPELVTVLMCTKDRPVDVARAAGSVLASRDLDFELIVIDQSAGPESECVLRDLPHAGRLRYVRSSAVGKSAAMNEGLLLAGSGIVVCTDDDCEAPPDWVVGMAMALHQRPEVAAVFYNVVAGPFDPSAGYVPTYERDADRLLSSVLETRRGRGLGAGMALRRDAVLALGGMDEALGPGARFFSCDDWDIELRVLLRGWKVFHTAEFSVVHHGFRSFAEGREHAHSNWVGIGAALAKLIRAGHPSVLLLALWEFGMHALLPPLSDVAHLRQPRGLRRIVGFCGGFAAGLRTPVDRKTLRYRESRAAARAKPELP